MEKSNVSKIVKDGLCSSCGVCVGACRNNCISFLKNRNRAIPVVNESACNTCGLCYAVCPGKGASLEESAVRLFPKSVPNIFAGRYVKTYAGFSKDEDVRFHSASGGMVTQMLIFLLERKIIDGALVVRFNRDNPFDPEPFIAKSRDELLQSRGSKYMVISYDSVINEIAKFGKRIVVVGLPCQIQGFRNLSKVNKSVRELVVGYFGLYCSCTKVNSSVNYYIWRYHIKRDKVKFFSFRDDGCYGFMKFSDQSHSPIKKIPYHVYWKGTRGFFVNKRCALCSDHFAELADISFGDSDHQPYVSDHIGISSLIVRNEYWDKIIRKAAEENYVYVEETTMEEITDKQIYAKIYKKGKGLKAAMRLRELFCLKNPYYGVPNNVDINFKDLITSAIRAIMKEMGQYKIVWPLIKILDTCKK